MTEERLPERIVCAAIQRGDMTICGVRHWDEFMRAQVKALGENHVGWTQGFVTSRYRFVRRAEAWEIAYAQGQIRLATTNSVTPCLCSEDLY